VRYVVKPGDTLSTLAARYIAPEHDWRDLQRVWKVRDPRRLPAGQVLSIPRGWLRWTAEEAQVVSVRGTVTLMSGRRTVPSTVGTVLREGAEIDTAANSFATLVLTNGSRLALPSQSHVTLSKLRKFAINSAIDYRFLLDRGRVDAKVTPLTDRSGNFIINTPLAMTAVRGTEFSAAFNPAQKETATGVFAGETAISRPDGTEPQLIPEKYGAITDAAGNSRKVELLPAPDLENPGRVQTGDIVTFDVTPVPDALGYHALLASDAGFVESYDEQQSTTPHFAFANVPNGNQFLRISAIEAGDLRGLRQSYSFVRRLASIGAEVGKTADGFAFKWFGSGKGTRHYRLQIFRDAPQGTPIVDEVGLTDSEATIRNLPPGVYFWRVAVSQTDPEGAIENWTDPEKLTIAGPDGG
jgi:hypothetical protein